MRPVYVEYTRGDRKGERYVVESSAKAKDLHPDATILHYEATPGVPYKESKPESAGLAAHTVAELEDMARTQGIAYSGLNKTDLVAALEHPDVTKKGDQ